MALANNLTAILNLLALLCSIPITASGIWLASKPDNECVNLLRWPVVVLGVLILVVSACGFIGAYQYKETLLAVYLCCMAILIGLLLVVLIFAFVVTRPDGSYQVPGRGYKEYRLEGFSNWLRENVVGSKNWGKIRACLADSNVCPKLSQQFITADQFFSSSSITALQSGCCKPPTACGQGRPSAQRGEAQALGPQIFLGPHLKKKIIIYIFLSFMVQKKIVNEVRKLS
ncbi:tetraspanin-2 isoform X1 [Brassica napus]|uniref:tetraspanin-2 isoform X1 n=1 Tax=Brassica napus TaxID=3708 RepID=UPI00207919D6|nr:tetraspanin-2 isoform X1 [Brassica napus]